MRVLMRADASPTIGGGHVMRCLILADALHRRGHGVSFLTNPEALATVPALRGATLARENEPADVVVVDHYGLTLADQCRLRAERQARRLVVIDDLADRIHSGDLILHSGAGRVADDYRGLVPAQAQILAGARYAIVRPDILACREASLAARRARPDGLVRIVITFGLSDTAPFVAAAITACAAVVPAAAVDVIVGPTTAEAVRRLMAGRAGLTLHVDPPDYAALLSRADLAIGGAGGSAFERCVLGLPSIALCMVPNQEANAGALARAGVARVIPSAADLAELLRELASAPDALRVLSRECAAFCDGRGAERIATAIEGTLPAGSASEEPATLGPATREDARFIWVLRNDPGVRAWSRDAASIPLDRHLAWFARSVDNPQIRLFVAVIAGWPVATLRFDQDGGEAEVSIAVSPLARKCGHGLAVLVEGCRLVLESGFASSLRAVVHRKNVPSMKLFAAANFREDGGTGPWATFRLTPRWPIGDRPAKQAS